MPSRLKFYRDKKKALKARNRQRKRNYAKRRFNNGKKHRRWATWECHPLMYGTTLTDTELARVLKRSVQSLQIKRCRMLKKGRGNDG